MTKIYIVMGQTGVHDDYQEWPFIAYTNKELAKAKVKEMNDWLRSKCAHEDFLGLTPRDWKKVEKLLRSIDKRASIDYTGSNYFIKEIDFAG